MLLSGVPEFGNSQLYSFSLLMMNIRVFLPFFALMNRATLNSFVHVFMWIQTLLLRGAAGPQVRHVLNFYRNCRFPSVVVPFHPPPPRNMRPTPLSALGIVSL